MGKARKLKQLRRSLRENTDPEIKMQIKNEIKHNKGTAITRQIIRHDPNSRRGLYKQIKKQGDYGEE